jgi:23S rRNA (adenine-N6)-dimethyltransferase
MARLHTYSQHFLRNPDFVKELIGHSNLSRRDTVLDIGAGSGVITAALASRVHSVVAIEPEPKARELLVGNTSSLTNITIQPHDFLTMNLPSEPYKVFSNIPFHLSSAIVRKLTEAAHPPTAIYLIAQKQFARKLVPGTDHFTAQLGAELGVRFSVRIRKPLKRTDFTPPPNVDTVLLELLLRPTPLIPESALSDYRVFITQCYSRQKFYQQVIQKTKAFSPELRPSQLSLEQWVNLYNLYTRA